MFHLLVFIHVTTIYWETNICRLLKTDTRHNVLSSIFFFFCKSWNLVWNIIMILFNITYSMIFYFIYWSKTSQYPLSSGNEHLKHEDPCSCPLKPAFHTELLSFSASLFVPVLLFSVTLLILVFWPWYSLDWCSKNTSTLR